MSQIGGNVVGSLVVDISAPPERALAGIRVVEAETQRVAATTGKAGEAAGAAFGVGMARGVGKVGKAFYSAINGLLIVPGIAAAAFALGKVIGDSIFNGADPKLKSLESRIHRIGKVIDSLGTKNAKDTSELLNQAGQSTEAITIEERRKRILELKEAIPKTQVTLDSLERGVNEPTQTIEARERAKAARDRVAAQRRAQQGELQGLTEQESRDSKTADAQREKNEAEKAAKARQEAFTAELALQKQAEKELEDMRKKARDAELEAQKQEADRYLALLNAQRERDAKAAEKQAKELKETSEKLQKNLETLADAVREATSRMRAFTNSQLDGIAADVSNLANVLSLRQPPR